MKHETHLWHLAWEELVHSTISIAQKSTIMPAQNQHASAAGRSPLKREERANGLWVRRDRITVSLQDLKRRFRYAVLDQTQQSPRSICYSSAKTPGTRSADLNIPERKSYFAYTSLYTVIRGSTIGKFLTPDMERHYEKSRCLQQEPCNLLFCSIWSQHVQRTGRC